MMAARARSRGEHPAGIIRRSRSPEPLRGSGQVCVICARRQAVSCSLELPVDAGVASEIHPKPSTKKLSSLVNEFW